jgi:hypothetical protein
MNDHVKIYFLDWQENRASKKEQIESHLKECESCRLYYDRMTKLLDPGIVTNLPGLIPDPFMPTRISALVEEQKQTEAKIIFSKIQLSLEGFVFIIAIVIGIVLGTTFSAEPHKIKTDDILSIYKNAVSQEDFSSQMEIILEPLEGDHQ